MRTGLLVILAVASLALSPASAASADDSGTTLRPDIEYALAHEPGGVLIDADTVEWPELGMTLRVATAIQTSAVGSCATGSVCAASGAGVRAARSSNSPKSHSLIS